MDKINICLVIQLELEDIICRIYDPTHFLQLIRSVKYYKLLGEVEGDTDYI